MNAKMAFRYFESKPSSLLRLALAAAITFGALAFFPAQAVQAANAVVGSGTPASCTEAEFDAKLGVVQVSGSGTLMFNCGPATAAIAFSSEKIITANVTIDGGGLILLNGGNTTRLFVVSSGAVLQLENITLTNGFSGFDGGAVFNQGTLRLENTIIRNSAVGPGFSGGAIASYGYLEINDSLLEGNRAPNGGAIFMRFDHGDALITGSTLRNNRATTVPTGGVMDGQGGAILLWDHADLTISNSIVAQNSAHYGGAIHNRFTDSDILISDGTVIARNRAVEKGGGIYNSSRFALLIFDTTFSANEADEGGGLFAGLNSLGLFTSTTFIGNQADDGGAINFEGNATLINSTVSGNFASHAGGGIYLDAFADVILTNVTFSGNSARSFGGAISKNPDAMLDLTNVIIANSHNGGNCDDDFRTGGVVMSHTLSDDLSCLVSGTGNVHDVNARIAPLTWSGGRNATHLPLPGSPVINSGTPTGAPLTDQRGYERPVGGVFDMGAVELQPFDRYETYLPLAHR